MLTQSQEKFLAQRRLFSKLGLWVGMVTLLILIIFVVYMYLKQPLLANPYYIMAQINNNSLPVSTLSFLAILGASTILIVSFIFGVVLLFFILAGRNERKLINIIDTLQKHDA